MQSTTTPSHALTYVGMVRSWASWAKIARSRLAALATAGWRIGIHEVAEDRLDPLFPLDPSIEAMTHERPRADVILTFISPLEYGSLPADAPRVAQLDYEASVWPAEWVSAADRFADHVVVPSTFNRDTLVACGFPSARVHVVPYGINPEVFTPAGRRPAGSRRGLELLFVGTPARRKGLDILLAAVRAAFSRDDEVRLRIHIVDYPDLEARPYLDHDWRGRVERLCSEGYRVEVTTAMMFDDGMAELYRSADLLCHTFRAESFCMPLVEAMACGTPVLATAWGGPLDFLDASVGWLVEDYALVPGGSMLLDNTGDAALVAEPSVAEVAATLREVFEHREQIAERGNAAARRGRHFAWSAAGQVLSHVLERTVLEARARAAAPPVSRPRAVVM